MEESKRNIGSVKNKQHGGKVKRDATYDDFPDESEIDSSIYQNAPFNYNDLSYVMNELYPNYGTGENIQNEKRFLGELIEFYSQQTFFFLFFLSLTLFRMNGIFFSESNKYRLSLTV